MWRATIRGILARKVRLLLTALAVILGVAFISATFIITDTIKASYGQVVSQFGSGSELVVTSTRSAFSVLGFGGSGSSVAASSLPVVAATPGVRAASGIVQSDGLTLLDRNGKPFSGGFNTQTLGISWPQSDAGPFSLVAGRAPAGPDEIALDLTTADRNGYAVGDTIDAVVSNGGKQTYRIVGTIGLGGTAELGGVTYAAFDVPTAQRLFQKPDQFDIIFVAVEPDADLTAVAQDLRVALGPEFTVINTQAFVSDQAQESGDFFQFINRFILGFGVLGVFVGGFIIANTFVILVQQRTRELALLRALGATGWQVRVAVLFEAVLLGVVASFLGFLTGIAFGLGALRLLTSVGLDVPDVTPVIQTRTLIWALLIGVTVTVISAIWPANRAAETAPMAAIADVRPRPSKPFLRPRPLDPPPESASARVWRLIFTAVLVVQAGTLVLGMVRPSPGLPTWFPAAAIWMLFWIVIAFGAAVHRSVARFVFSRLTLAVEFTALGIAYIVAAVFADVVAEEDAIIVAGIGSLTLFLGVVIGTALVARPIARVLGTRPVGVAASLLGVLITAVAGWSLVRGITSGERSGFGLVGAALAVVAGLALAIAGPALFGTIGKLARGNAMRNPRRTATTASALVIGMALICLVAVFTASAQDDARRAIAGGVNADLVISADRYAGFSAAVTADVAALPATENAVALQYLTAEINGERDTVVGVTPEGLGTVLDLDFSKGSSDGLASGGVILADYRAKDLGVGVGDTVTFTGSNDTSVTAPVVGLYRNDRFTGQQPAFVMVSSQLAEQIAGRVPSANQIFVQARDGDVDALREQLGPVLEQYPTVAVRSYQEFIDDSVGFLGQILNIFVGLLLLSLLIALLGIINTLLLSVYERTRELGLLRAIGTTRLQVRRMIRGEAVIIAVLGSFVGLALGLIWSWVFVAALSGNGFRSFTVPWTQLIAFTALAAAAAVLASVFPAWRAGQLNVLEAIAEE